MGTKRDTKWSKTMSFTMSECAMFQQICDKLGIETIEECLVKCASRVYTSEGIGVAP